MSARLMRRETTHVIQQGSSPLVVSAQNRSKPSEKKRVHWLQQTIRSLFEVFFHFEVVRQVGPGKQPLAQHEFDVRHQVFGPRIF